MTEQDSLLDDIDFALKASGVSATAFGYKAVGDPGILRRLREGREARPALLKKLKSALADMEIWGTLG